MDYIADVQVSQWLFAPRLLFGIHGLPDGLWGMVEEGVRFPSPPTQMPAATWVLLADLCRCVYNLIEAQKRLTPSQMSWADHVIGVSDGLQEQALSHAAPFPAK